MKHRLASGLWGTEIICYQTKQKLYKQDNKHILQILSKMGWACQKRDAKKKSYTAFAYELLYSTIIVCTRSAATITIGTVNGEAIALADADCKFYCSPCVARFLDNVEKEHILLLIKYLFPLLKLNRKSIRHKQIKSIDSLLARLAKHSNSTE